MPNRSQTKAGGDQNGGNQRSASYSVNNLNQYTQRAVPGYADIMGISFATNTVTVGGQTAYRKGEYFRGELAVNNTSVPIWTNIVVSGTGQTSVTGHVFVAQSPESFSYDLDGNLTNDGRWAYTWDAENRLVKLAPNSPTGPRNSLMFEYDWQGRRIHKQVWANTSWSGWPTNDVKFIYDGWNLLAELNGTNSAVIRAFAWGNDLSGTVQGAGGVGGLLFICDLPSAIGYCAPSYDGNGNVIGLVSMSGGTNCASYEYGPFGELLRATGPMATANPFRFSTKYEDDETDLLYYGYRYYSASTGRWQSWDPIASDLSFADQHHDLAEELEGTEESTANVLGFLSNDPVRKVDKLGLWGASDHDLQTYAAWLPVVFANPSPCADALWGLVINANLEQDTLYMFNESHHYNRTPCTSRSQGNKNYKDYVRAELDRYDKALKTPSKKNCAKAAVALGHATHSWQDFFAHARSAKYKWKAWENNAGGTPDGTGDLFP